MNESDQLLIETSERAKSNTHQIEEIKEDIKEIKSDQKAIYEISTSVKLIAQSMTSMKEDIAEVKQGQCDLANKVDERILEVNVGQKKLEDHIQLVDDKTKVDWAKNKTANLIWLASGAGIMTIVGVVLSLLGIF